MIKLVKPKTCACGVTYISIPDVPLFEGDELTGYYFDCACRSTLYVPVSMVQDPEDDGIVACGFP